MWCTRLQIVGAFVLFALLAAPVAWHLTQVERVDLPVSRIEQLSWSASRFGGSERFHVDIYSFGSKKSSSLSSSAPNVAYTTQQLQLTAGQKNTLEKAVELGLQATDNALETLVTTKHKHFSVFLLCDDAAASTPVLTIGKYRHAWSPLCQVTEGDALHSAIEKMMYNHVYPQLPDRKQSTETKMARRALQYRLQFSLLKENPLTLWKEDLRVLVDQYLGRFVQKVGVLANFTVETQVVHYARLAKEVEQRDDGKEFYINADDLKHFKSANDFLDASVLDDGEQVLHFMAALPDTAHAPLYIRPSDDHSKAGLATAFELPGWGIAAILNPHALYSQPPVNASVEEAAALTTSSKERELQRVMGLFVSEFRTLLGVPSFTQRQRKEDNLRFLPSTSDGIADWELDIIMRDRFTELMQTAIETLQSTVELVEALPELSVLERVQMRVETAVTRLEAILCDTNFQQCVDASDLRSLLAMARQASHLTDAAYYDHTMIRQLYFPQEQMLGVYAPLLAPLMLPFLLGIIRELKRFKAKRAAKKVKLQ
ncbi:GPI transamidase component PIG-S [Phytophthora citrophthora]|uniref:GPI transamidase component PIG-S n=1 Tax=Phytophthora citrophthora TaxID=4793 RepID=A0AAD9GR63_9STRA|nr:GPI transamidase component PIG-S [Phytophthora citrophthora]